MKHFKTPIDNKQIQALRVGDKVLLDGVIYTARDQAHKRLVETLSLGKRLPFQLEGSMIYYCGPTKTPKARVIGSCGPTTSSRMDSFTPQLLKVGLKGMIGKGARSKEVISAIKRYQGIYFVTYAGCGALLSRYVKSLKPIAYTDLGPEAIYKLEVRDFPLIVAVDVRGGRLYD